MKQFILFWNDGRKSVVTAPSISEVFTRYTQSVLNDLTFYTTI